MAIDRWDPFRETRSFRELMDRMFRDGFARPVSDWFADVNGSIPVDVSETDKAFVVRASIPGVKPEDIQISAHGDRLTLRAQSQSEHETRDGESYLMRERQVSSFYRTLTLPAPVNPDTAEAKYDQGVLTLTLPKAAPGQPRQIKVQGGSATQSGSQLGSGQMSNRQSMTQQGDMQQAPTDQATPKPSGVA
ncbi:MAG TPA: Hsp20/alpha crystallin family protein [Ktedonobacterales bacterium]|nr:Hsp20/alpha crystallin family protein [Ktedonobacterales bacterium]